MLAVFGRVICAELLYCKRCPVVSAQRKERDLFRPTRSAANCGSSITVVLQRCAGIQYKGGCRSMTIRQKGIQDSHKSVKCRTCSTEMTAVR